MTGEGPPGAWGEILVGQFWTPYSDLSIVRAAVAKRKTTSAAWQSFSDQLHETLSGPISPEIQKGVTADTIRQSFTWSADQASDVADINEVISKAHSSGHNSAAELNSQLVTIAQDGDARIKEIQGSRDPAPIKVGKIVEVVAECQQRATTAAAVCAQNIFEAMQAVLAQRGVPKSSRQFAQELGIDSTRMFGSPSKDAIRQQVQALVNGTGSSPMTGGPGSPTVTQPESKVGEDAVPPGAPGHLLVNQPRAMVGRDAVPTAPAPIDQPQAKLGGSAQPPTPAALPTSTSTGATVAPATASSPMPTTGVSTSPGPVSPVAPTTIAPGLAQAGMAPTTPTTGAPLPAATNALPPTPTAPQLPSTPAMPAQASATPPLPPAAMAPVFETAPAAHVPPSEPVPAAAPPPLTPAYVAPPAVAAPPPLPAGPLPTYGADIRPPAASVPTAPPPTAPAGSPPPAMPASAPANLQAGAGPVATSAPRQPTAPSPPAAISGQMALATTGGAITGATAAQAGARARLQRLVDFVARQQPRLSWAAGERPDGTTVLVTDLASGWIPPEVEIPSTASLLDPARRSGGLESLLGEVSVSASYTRLHYLPPAEYSQPVPTSARARHGPLVDELGWELGQATKWRDGLSRLAHTLAKAASTGTGVLDSEAELLRKNLAAVADQVLESYPDTTDAGVLGNWQLLAAIDALVADDKTAAHYHFRWFQALNCAP